MVRGTSLPYTVEEGHMGYRYQGTPMIFDYNLILQELDEMIIPLSPAKIFWFSIENGLILSLLDVEM